MLNNIVALLSDGVTAAVASFESIATVTVGSGGAANIEFTSIPATYKHLQVRCFSIMSFNDGFGKLQFNSDTGNNYATHQLYGDGASVGAGANTSVNYIRTTVSALSGTNPLGASIVDILDYTNTNKYTTVRTLTGSDTNGAGYMMLQSGVWMNTNAITSLKITANSGNFNQYSSFALFGIKGA